VGTWEINTNKSTKRAIEEEEEDKARDKEGRNTRE
jgi:hypothetical protein